MPGMISHTTNLVEHPELIAERIVRFAKIVGRENIIAGADCGFAASALRFNDIHPQRCLAQVCHVGGGRPIGNQLKASAALSHYPSRGAVISQTS